MIEAFPSMEQLQTELQQAVRDAGGIRPFARKAGVSPGRVHDGLQGRITPAVMNAIGWVQQTRWVRVQRA